MIFPIKPEGQILNEIIADVKASTAITDFTAGSVARSLLEIIGKRISDLYTTMDTYMAMTFVSTAEGIYLDMIGKMLGCDRLSALETDTNYRYRITKQTLSAAKANETAVRLAALSVDGVNDVVILPYSHGNGSFSVYVVTDELVPDSETLLAVESAVAEAKALGIRAFTLAPVLVPFTFEVVVTLTTGAFTTETLLKSQLAKTISTYLDGVEVGGSVSIYELLKLIQANAAVVNAYFSKIMINESKLINTSNYKLAQNERPWLSKITVKM